MLYILYIFGFLDFLGPLRFYAVRKVPLAWESCAASGWLREAPRSKMDRPSSVDQGIFVPSG